MSILEKQIKSYFYINNPPDRIYQGDLLKNVEITINDNVGEKISGINIKFPYVVVLSQDCDLEQYFSALVNKKEVFNQYIPNILIVPCFLNDDFKTGENLLYLRIRQNSHNSSEMKQIKNLQVPRYHYIPQDEMLEIPDLFIDFKVFYTIAPEQLFKKYKDLYIATVNALFREKITQRYTNYISRIGLPNLDTFVSGVTHNIL